jgi:tetratricopeptide (TPR) repeat protein
MKDPGSLRGERAWRCIRRLPAVTLLLSSVSLLSLPSTGRAQASGSAVTSPATPETRVASGAQPPVPRSPRADSLFRLGESIERDHPLPAMRYYREAAALARRSDDTLTLAKAQYRLGITFWARNLYDSALVYLDSALVVRRRIDDPVELARVYNGLGASYYQLGIYEPALEAFVQALRLRRVSRDSMGLARTLTNIGKVYHDWGQLERARVTLQEATQVAERVPNGAAALGYALNSLAMLEIDRGNLVDARRLIDQSIAAYALPHGRTTRADSVESWEFNATSTGTLLLREGRAPEATIVLDSVLASSIERRSDRARARALLYLGEANMRMGNVAKAREQFTESLALSRIVGQRIIALAALDHLSELEYGSGNARAAVGYLRAYRVLRDTIFDQDAALRIAAREARYETDAALRANVQLQARGVEQQVVISRQRSTVIMGSVILALVSALLLMLVYHQRRERARAAALAAANAELASVNEELRTALAEVRTLSGLIPICANCKKVRDDRGYWEAVETFVAERSNATFSHSICQSCGPQLYGDLWPGSPQG